MWLPLTHPLLGTWPETQACALDWELNLRPFGLQAGAQATEPHQPGLDLEPILLFLCIRTTQPLFVSLSICSGMKRPLSPSPPAEKEPPIPGDAECPPPPPEPPKPKREKKRPSYTLCDVCNIQLNSAAQAQVHCEGRAHQRRLRQLSLGKAPPGPGQCRGSLYPQTGLWVCGFSLGVFGSGVPSVSFRVWSLPDAGKFCFVSGQPSWGFLGIRGSSGLRLPREVILGLGGIPMESHRISTPVWSALAGRVFWTKASPAGYPGLLLWCLQARPSWCMTLQQGGGWTREAPLPLATVLLARISASP